MFECEYLNGKKNGKGKEYSSNNKLMYEGEYLNGKRNGKGKEYEFLSNTFYECEYLNGVKIKGKKNNEDKKLIEGKIY